MVLVRIAFLKKALPFRVKLKAGSECYLALVYDDDERNTSSTNVNIAAAKSRLMCTFDRYPIYLTLLPYSLIYLQLRNDASRFQFDLSPSRKRINSISSR